MPFLCFLPHKKISDRSCRLFLCRDDTTRTCDPLVPNQVYYQLYYIPNAFFKASAKLRHRKQNTKFSSTFLILQQASLGLDSSLSSFSALGISLQWSTSIILLNG